jgi:hypothetical protein
MRQMLRAPAAQQGMLLLDPSVIREKQPLNVPAAYRIFHAFGTSIYQDADLLHRTQLCVERNGGHKGQSSVKFAKMSTDVIYK